MCALAGCSATPHVLPAEERKVIDRKLVERPSGFDLELYALDLDQPVAVTFDADGNLLVAEGGIDGSEPRVYGFTPDRQLFEVYPLDKKLFNIGRTGFRMYGPVGGILWHNGELYVSHRNEKGLGVISAMDYKGHVRTVVSDLPARGEHGVTDLAIDKMSGRLFFGMGSATNSGVVGIDDYSMGWVKDYPDVHDVPYTPDRPLSLWGRRFNSPDPSALFLAPNILVTSAFQKFGESSYTRIKGADRNNPRCNSSILSVAPEGGDLRVEAHGIRCPVGLAFNEYGALYFTNQGMELRGTRPVRDDPDTLLKLFPGSWFGWPDYSTDLQPIGGDRFQPPLSLVLPSGFRDVSALTNHGESGLVPPDDRFAKNAVFGVMPSQSGAAGIEFGPTDGPFKGFAGSAIVALSGDHQPFGTGGQPTTGPIGFKVVRVDNASAGGQVRDFVFNVQSGPSSKIGNDIRQLERPIDVKFGPDGAMYILDFGQMEMKENGRPKIRNGTGRIYRLLPARSAVAPAALSR